MIDLLFPVAIYKGNFHGIDNRYLENKAYDLKRNIEVNEKTQWRCDTFSTLDYYDKNIDQDDIVNFLVENSTYLVEDFARKMGAVYQKIDCRDFWFNISSPENFQEFHQHPGCHFSAVYYVKAPVNSGRIVFMSPENFTDMFPLPIPANNFNNLSYKSYYYDPCESMILIFRSNIAHMVEKNLSGEDRISIAMNFVLS
jgi:uncharacterized protein (TIGR02466 family)